MADEISRDVDQFIRNHISSVEQLEVLLLLKENSAQGWTAVQVAQKLYRQPGSVAAHLETFRAARLITGAVGQAYRYAPNSGTDDATVSALERAYRERKDTVIHLIFSRPSDTLRAFSNAFRFRRD